METCLNPYTVSVLQNKNVKIFYCPLFMNRRLWNAASDVQRAYPICHQSVIRLYKLFFAPVCPMLTSHPHSSRHFASMFFQMCPAKASARQEINEHDGMAVYGWGIITCS